MYESKYSEYNIIMCNYSLIYFIFLQSVAFPELNSLTVAELELLNTNVDRLDEFVDTLPVMKEINRNLEDWMTGVEELASKSIRHTIQ